MHTHTEAAGFLKVSLLPCILSFASHNRIFLSKLPEPKLRMSRHWAVSTSEGHEWAFPPPKEHISQSSALLLLEDPLRLAAVLQVF